MNRNPKILAVAGKGGVGKTSLSAAFVRLELLAALLSGDQHTFETFRCEAPELVHLPQATYEWYCRNYLDRDYPFRMLLRCNGVTFPDRKEA